MPNARLLQPLAAMPRIGQALGKQLAKLGIQTAQDALLYLPFRYENRTQYHNLNQSKDGDTVQLLVQLRQINLQITPHAQKKLLTVMAITPDGETITLKFFHFNPAQQQRLQQFGKWARIYGVIRADFAGWQMLHPSLHIADSPEFLQNLPKTLTPIYPTHAGLPQYQLQKIMAMVLPWRDELPILMNQTDLPPHWASLSESVRQLHAPTLSECPELIYAPTHPARLRLAIEELLAHRLYVLAERRVREQLRTDILFDSNHIILKKYFETIRQNLNFQFTQAQARVIQEIHQDLAKNTPMLRLVQGDVGSGKTVIALMAILCALANGKQAALMTPTALLAEQHFVSFTAWFQILDLKVYLLTAGTPAPERRAIKKALKEGECALVIGTHALLQADVQCAALALVVIDEQHRFGVNQRLQLSQQNLDSKQTPHQLMMTATPIPRTLALSHYAALQHSIVDELPPNRTPVQTVAIPMARRADVIARLAKACAQGKQAYWVCTLVETNEKLEAEAANEHYAELCAALPQLRFGLVHGRLKESDKEAVMRLFSTHQIDVLVATTVIEVGVNVPNASLMVIDNAERLGLAQLHQLRGRVGRGDVVSYCVLLHRAPLSPIAHERLSALRESTDGFWLAEQDLKLRGPGEFVGQKQAGFTQFRVANLVSDAAYLPLVQALSEKFYAESEVQPTLIQDVIARWLPNAESLGA